MEQINKNDEDLLKFNNVTDKFELYVRGETIDEINSGTGRMQPYIISDSLNPIIEHRMDLLTQRVILNEFDKFPYKEDFGPITLVTQVVKSKSKKSVHQYYSHSNHHDSEIFNLPGRFREINFNSILSRQEGPFTKTKIGGKLMDVDTWYYNQVYFAGTTTECLEQIVAIWGIKSFFMDQAKSLFENAETEDHLNLIHKCLSEATDNNNLKGILHNLISEYFKKFEEEQENQCEDY